MIFPHIRISDLKRDLESKERAFDYSRRIFGDRLRQKTKPIQFFRDHSKLLLGILFSLVTSIKFLKGTTGMFLGKKTKNKIFWKIIKAGWAWKLAKIMGGKSLKSMGPTLNTLAKATLKKFF